MRQVHRARREADRTPAQTLGQTPGQTPGQDLEPPPPQTREERARDAQREALEFSRLQSAAYNATGEERQAAQKAFDEFRARVAEKYGTAGEKESQTRRKSKSRRMGL